MFLEGAQHLAVHRQLGQLQLSRRRVQQSQYYPLAVCGGDGGHPDIHRVAGDPHRDPAVLRHPLLGDVQPRHNLQSRHQQRRQHAFGRQYLGQYAVDAIAHAEPVLERLDMDIRRLLAHRL